jgi:hypothetical protein
MRKSFSPFWDRLVVRCIRERNPGPLVEGRRIELMVMGLVLFPETRIHAYWEAGCFAELAFLSEYIRAGIPSDLARTDPLLFHNLTKGMTQIKQLGWDRRLQPGPLRIRAAAQKRRAEAQAKLL